MLLIHSRIMKESQEYHRRKNTPSTLLFQEAEIPFQIWDYHDDQLSRSRNFQTFFKTALLTRKNRHAGESTYKLNPYRRSKSQPTCSYSYLPERQTLRYAHQEDRAELFLAQPTTRNNGQKPTPRKFHLDTGNNLFPVRVTEHWHRLPREVGFISEPPVTLCFEQAGLPPYLTDSMILREPENTLGKWTWNRTEVPKTNSCPAHR